MEKKIYTATDVINIIQAIYSGFAELPLHFHTTAMLRSIIKNEVENHPLKPIKIFK